MQLRPSSSQRRACPTCRELAFAEVPVGKGRGECGGRGGPQARAALPRLGPGLPAFSGVDACFAAVCCGVEVRTRWKP